MRNWGNIFDQWFFFLGNVCYFEKHLQKFGEYVFPRKKLLLGRNQKIEWKWVSNLCKKEAALDLAIMNVFVVPQELFYMRIGDLFFLAKLANFWPEKSDFNMCKWFIYFVKWLKFARIWLLLHTQLPEFRNRFQQVAKNIKGC